MLCALDLATDIEFAVNQPERTLRIRIATDSQPRVHRGKRFAAKSLLALVSLAISLVGVQRTHRCLTILAAPAHRARVGKSNPEQALLHADLWRQILESEAAALPFRAECSEISLSLHALMLLGGHRGEVVIGHRLLQDNVQGHTWLMLEGQVVSELGEPDKAYPILHVRLR